MTCLAQRRKTRRDPCARDAVEGQLGPLLHKRPPFKSCPQCAHRPPGRRTIEKAGMTFHKRRPLESEPVGFTSQAFPGTQTDTEDYVLVEGHLCFLAHMGCFSRRNGGGRVGPRWRTHCRPTGKALIPKPIRRRCCE